MKVSKLVTKKCLNCGKSFQVYFCRRNTAKFCSYHCHGKFLLTKEEMIKRKMGGLSRGRRKIGIFINCKECGKKVYSHLYKIRQFCSTSCAAKYRYRLNPLPVWNKGLKAINDRRILSGDKKWNWKGGVTPINKKIRKSKEYAIWRIAVFIRDDYTCQDCGERGSKLNADHIKPFVFYPELRYAIDNGRTLCEVCHRQTETWGNRVFKTMPKNDKEEIKEEVGIEI